MSEIVNVEGYIYHKIENIQELESLLISGPMINSSGIPVPVSEITLHWSGSSYKGFSHHYQVNICFDPMTKKAFALIADKSHFLHPEIHSHVWRRNSGRIGVSYICMFNQKLYPVTDEMMQFAGKVVSVLCHKYNIDVNKCIKDHKYHAIIDNYPNDRWDTELYLNKTESVTSRTILYALEASKGKPVTQPAIKPKQEVIKETRPAVLTPTVFEDVYKEDWYSAAIIALEKWDVLEGYKAKDNLRTFRPNDVLTREQSAQLIFELIQFLKKKLTIKDNQEIDTKIYIDVKDSKFKDAINYLLGNGILKGATLTSFNCIGTLTRAELAAIFFSLYKFFSKQLKWDIPAKFSEEPFLDLTPNHWAYESICFAYKFSLLVGSKQKEGHYFKPEDKVTRLQFAVALYKFITSLAKRNSIVL